MISWLVGKFRMCGRLLWFVAQLAPIIGDFIRSIGFRRGAAPLKARAAWLHRSSRRVLPILGLVCRAEDTAPERGLLVSNHLSYLDIIALSACTPAVFVAKHDIHSWPLFGTLAAMAGTVFINRSRRSDVSRVNDQVQRALSSGALVVVFPEGTSSNGDTVLPFKSSLLEPAMDPEHPLFISHIRYGLQGGSVKQEICYWGNMTFVPHLLHLLTIPRMEAVVRFQAIENRGTDRKELARQLRAKVLALDTCQCKVAP